MGVSFKAVSAFLVFAVSMPVGVSNAVSFESNYAKDSVVQAGSDTQLFTENNSEKTSEDSLVSPPLEDQGKSADSANADSGNEVEEEQSGQKPLPDETIPSSSGKSSAGISTTFSSPAQQFGTSSWEVRDSVLHIGPGKLGPTNENYLPPWDSISDKLTKVVFDDPANTSLSSNAAFMFRNMSLVTEFVGIGDIDTSQLSYAKSMFYSSWSFTSLDLSKWDTKKLKRADFMFYNTQALTSIDLSGWNTKSLGDIGAMFAWAISLKEINFSGWDTGALYNAGSAFYASGLSSLDLSSWNTSNVTSITSTFSYMPSLTELDISSWDTSKVTRGAAVFTGSPNLRKLALGPKTKLFATVGLVDLENPPVNSSSTGVWQSTNNGDENLPVCGWLGSSEDLIARSSTETADVYIWHSPDSPTLTNSWDTSCWEIRDDVLYIGDGQLPHTSRYTLPWIDHVKDVTKVVFQNPENTTLHYDSQGLLALLSNVTEIQGINDVDASRVSIADEMFYDLRSMTSIDLSGWDTPRLISTYFMFYNAQSLTSINLSGWKTSNLDRMNAMFAWTKSLEEVNFSGWDTRRLSEVTSFFYASGIKSLDFSSWNTPALRNTGSAFAYMPSLVELDLSGWDISQVKAGGNLFDGTSTLRKLTLGPKTKLQTTSGLFNPPNSDGFTGLWQSIGDGSIEAPLGSWSGNASDLIARSELGYQDTYVWQTNNVAVLFDANGGTFDGDASSPFLVPFPKDGGIFTIATNGSAVPAVTKEGFQFSGWTTTKDDPKTKVSSLNVSETTTLYALWKVPLEITKAPAGFYFGNKNGIDLLGRSIGLDNSAYSKQQQDDNFVTSVKSGGQSWSLSASLDNFSDINGSVLPGVSLSLSDMNITANSSGTIITRPDFNSNVTLNAGGSAKALIPTSSLMGVAEFHLNMPFNGVKLNIPPIDRSQTTVWNSKVTWSLDNTL